MIKTISSVEQIQNSFDQLFTAADAKDGEVQQHIDLSREQAELIDGKLSYYYEVTASLQRHLSANGAVIRDQYYCAKARPIGDYSITPEQIVVQAGKLWRSDPPLRSSVKRKLAPGTVTTADGLVECNEAYAANFAARIDKLATVLLRIWS